MNTSGELSGCAADGANDRIGGLAPYEGPGILGVLMQILPDRFLPIFDAGWSTTFDPPRAQRGEGALDPMEPRRRGWREVRPVARMPGQPGTNGVSLVPCVVVHDQAHVPIGRHRRIDRIEKLQKFGAATASLELPDQLLGGERFEGNGVCRRVPAANGDCAPEESRRARTRSDQSTSKVPRNIPSRSSLWKV